MGKYFGTDGFRGKAGEVLTAEHAFRTGRFLGWYYANRHASGTARIVIGKDTRRSSYMYESALARGHHVLRRGRLSSACYNDALRQLHHAHRKL